jgi:hypothetical protein
MSIITKINSIPVFTTKTQALSWGRLNGYVGYREEFHFGKRGYIAGKTSGSIAFQKYPAQRATASLAFKNQPQSTLQTLGSETMIETPTVVQSGSDGSGGY